jgi:hypothetical protein
MAMRLLHAKATASSGGMVGGTISNGKGGSKTTVQIQMDRAADLPQGKADISGSVTEVKDNSLIVQPGSKMGGSADANNGPATEVVITKDTKIWRDVSFDNVPKPSAGSSQGMHIQQKVEAANLAQITANSMVIVWGQRRGDRVIADVVVSMGPAVIQAKSNS